LKTKEENVKILYHRKKIFNFLKLKIKLADRCSEKEKFEILCEKDYFKLFERKILT